MRIPDINTHNTNSSINIAIINSSIAERLPKKRIKNVILKSLEYEKITKASINVIIVDSEYMIQLNDKYLKHNYATDVLAFELEDEPLEGEIYICYQTALSQAKEYKVTITNELCRLAVHGTLHLLGYNDDTEINKKIMYQLQEKIIQE